MVHTQSPMLSWSPDFAIIWFMSWKVYLKWSLHDHWHHLCWGLMCNSTHKRKKRQIFSEVCLLMWSPIQLLALLDLLWSPIQQLAMLDLMCYRPKSGHQNSDLTLWLQVTSGWTVTYTMNRRSKAYTHVWLLWSCYVTWTIYSIFGENHLLTPVTPSQNLSL